MREGGWKGMKKEISMVEVITAYTCVLSEAVNFSVKEMTLET